MNREQLTQDIFKAFYVNPEIQPEDIFKVLVAAIAAETLIKVLSASKSHSDTAQDKSGAADLPNRQEDTPSRRSEPFLSS